VRGLLLREAPPPRGTGVTKRLRHAYAAQAWAQEQRVGHVGLKATLLLLAAYADDEASCWPSQSRIAEETEQDERTVRRHLEILREAGLVISGRRMVNGLRSSDRHWLQLDVTVGVEDIEAARTRVEAKARERREARKALPDTVSGSQEDTVSGCLPDTRGGSYRTSEGGPTGHPLSYEGVEVLPSGVTSTPRTARRLAGAHASDSSPGNAPWSSTELRDRLAGCEPIQALRGVLAAAGLGDVSWRELDEEDLAQVVLLVDAHGAERLVAAAAHQANGRGLPLTARAWLPVWRDLVAPAVTRTAPRVHVVPEPEGHRVGLGQLRAMVRGQHAGGAA